MKLSNLIPLFFGAHAEYTLSMRLCTKKGSRTGVIEEAQGTAQSFYIALDDQDYNQVNLPYHRPSDERMVIKMQGDLTNVKSVRVRKKFGVVLGG